MPWLYHIAVYTCAIFSDICSSGSSSFASKASVVDSELGNANNCDASSNFLLHCLQISEKMMHCRTLIRKSVSTS